MYKYNKKEKLFHYLFSFSCDELQSMQIIKDPKQTDIYKIEISNRQLKNNLTEDDIDYICDLIDPKHEYVCKRGHREIPFEFTNKILLILQAFLKHFR